MGRPLRKPDDARFQCEGVGQAKRAVCAVPRVFVGRMGHGLTWGVVGVLRLRLRLRLAAVGALFQHRLKLRDRHGALCSQAAQSVYAELKGERSQHRQQRQQGAQQRRQLGLHLGFSLGRRVGDGWPTADSEGSDAIKY